MDRGGVGRVVSEGADVRRAYGGKFVLDFGRVLSAHKRIDVHHGPLVEGCVDGRVVVIVVSRGAELSAEIVPIEVVVIVVVFKI